MPNEKVLVGVFAFKTIAGKSLEKSGHQPNQEKELKFTRITDE